MQFPLNLQFLNIPSVKLNYKREKLASEPNVGCGRMIGNDPASRHPVACSYILRAQYVLNHVCIGRIRLVYCRFPLENSLFFTGKTLFLLIIRASRESVEFIFPSLNSFSCRFGGRKFLTVRKKMEKQVVTNVLI